MPVKARFEELDSLRGIAALWVVLFHYTGGVTAWLPGQPDLVARITPWTGNLQGLYAVHLFFMISGFVIMMTLENTAHVRDFVVSRIARLYPAFWFALAVSGGVSLVWQLPRQFVTVPQILVNATMLQDFIGVKNVDDVYWSLTFEIGFYALAAMTLAAGAKRHAEKLGAMWVAVALLLQIMLPALGLALPWRVQAALALPYAGLFVAGLVFYRIWLSDVTVWRVGLLALCFAQQVIFAHPLVLMMTTAFFLIFILCVSGNAAFLRHRLLLWLGGISYPLYLIHAVVGIRCQLTLQALGLPAILNLLITLLFALTLAAFVSRFVEPPGRHAMRRVLSRRMGYAAS